MAKKVSKKEFMFLFRGGVDPSEMSPPEMERVMKSWMTWMGQLKQRGQLLRGQPLDEVGKVLSGPKGTQMSAFKEKKDSVGGYLLVQARDLQQAATIAKACPILQRGGSVEVRPLLFM